MIIYLDIIFVENLFMNYIILYGTGFLQKINMKNFKLIISSAIGAIYAIIEYLRIIPIYSNFLMKALLSIIMIYISYNPQSVSKMCKELLMFYLVSFATGGCALALMYLISPKSVILRNGVFVGIYPFKIILTAGAVGFIIIQYAFKINKKTLRKKELICNLEIFINKKSIKMKAFIDSGNILKEPISGMPVIVAEKAIIEKNLEIKMNGGDKTQKIRLIPYNSIGNQNGVMLGIKADKVIIKQKNDKEIINKNVVIGLYDKKINKDYSALIGIELLEGENENEHNKYIKENIF